MEYMSLSRYDVPDLVVPIQVFVLGRTKVGEGSGDCLRSPTGPGQSPGRRPRWESPPRKFLGFEFLGSFSINNFEAFCECDEVYESSPKFSHVSLLKMG
jgi:hypothetical protein